MIVIIMIHIREAFTCEQRSRAKIECSSCERPAAHVQHSSFTWATLYVSVTCADTYVVHVLDSRCWSNIDLNLVDMNLCKRYGTFTSKGKHVQSQLTHVLIKKNCNSSFFSSYLCTLSLSVVNRGSDSSRVAVSHGLAAFAPDSQFIFEPI